MKAVMWDRRPNPWEEEACRQVAQVLPLWRPLGALWSLRCLARCDELLRSAVRACCVHVATVHRTMCGSRPSFQIGDAQQWSCIASQSKRINRN